VPPALEQIEFFPGTLSQILLEQVVRKLLWNFGGVSAFCVFSGGEDGKLVAWSE
jgi:hypothetical protein